MEAQSGLAARAVQNRYHRPMKSLVENRTVYESHEAELSIYDTYEPARQVLLDADEILYCGMITGKKTLHGKNHYQANFLPHESFVMAPGETIAIDFPEARINQPTSCLTLGISRDKLRQVCDRLNKSNPIPQELGEWHYDSHQVLHTFHTEATQHLLIRMVDSFLKHDNDRDLVLNLGVTELLTRMMRQQGRDFLLSCAKHDPTYSSITAVARYIDDHLAEAIEVEQLCKLACMSRSKLYQQFKNMLGCGPMEYVHQRRLEHARDMIMTGKSITEACFSVGYVSASHFSRRFQQQYGVSPRHFSKNGENITQTDE
ncbi:helix-turn-helix domain-containing protein [Gynuella sp.]|uniref:helix-turn-helix domain-containing protein n=1 Tax=Gynuella sp. TaxID=2969146 RepID=UPI003D115DB4